MNNNPDYEDTQEILNRIFQQQKLKEENYVVNDFFSKNKDKYFTH